MMITPTEIYIEESGLLTFSKVGNRLAKIHEFEKGDRCVGSVFEALKPGEIIRLDPGLYVMDKDIDPMPFAGSFVASSKNLEQVAELVEGWYLSVDGDEIPDTNEFYTEDSSDTSPSIKYLEGWMESLLPPPSPLSTYSKLIAALLRLAADKFANHGCNDFDLAEIIPDVDERRRLVMQMHIANGDPENYDPEDDYKTMPDSWLMGFFAAQLGE